MIKWILWGVLGLLLLLFFCKSCMELLYLDGAVTVKLRLLYIFCFTIYPFPQLPWWNKGKTTRKNKTTKVPKTKPVTDKPIKQKEPVLIMDILQTINDILPIAGRSMGYWMRHTTINRLWVRAVVHEEDAADTAIKCGQLSGVAHTLYVWFSPRMHIRNFSFNAVPNFTSDERPLNVCLHISAAPSSMVWGMVLFLFRGGMAFWHGPLIAQMRKKQPRTVSGAKNKKQPVRRMTEQ